jgi:hypothetical protein
LTFLPSPVTSVLSAWVITSHVGQTEELFLQHGVGTQDAFEFEQGDVRDDAGEVDRRFDARSCRRRSPPPACP